MALNRPIARVAGWPELDGGLSFADSFVLANPLTQL